MRLSSFWRCAAAVAALVPSFATAEDADNPSGQSTFISPDKDLGFAFTIGNVDVNDYFVTMRLKTSRSWGAIGLGSNAMAGALYFVMYLNEKADNVTFSPRLAYGNYEPYFYDSLKWQYLNHSIKDGFSTLSFRCIDCQNWPGGTSGKGYLDFTSHDQKSIWALGPHQKLRSNDQKAALRFHESHGVFNIDMARTRGAEDTPALTDKSVDEGITRVKETFGRDHMATTLMNLVREIVVNRRNSDADNTMIIVVVGTAFSLTLAAMSLGIALWMMHDMKKNAALREANRLL
ncbi:hypothetical protein NLG97_g1163 [Lecanicillium saksenae]|uniref:Uncharacterized protein n=1 Tax=Lecanicillium saksenae TaxID=468837 RepID=A0ACC1R4I6_9HYPO|nr:hypothetical protein NLG97_g1163 [Lecanicillium saksenae]